MRNSPILAKLRVGVWCLPGLAQRASCIRDDRDDFSSRPRDIVVVGFSVGVSAAPHGD